MPSFDGETWAGGVERVWARAGKKSARRRRRRTTPLKRRFAFLNPTAITASPAIRFRARRAKHHGYTKTREMFLAASKYFDIAVERVAIPLQGKADRRPLAPAEKAPGADDHALGRHRQLERRAPFLRRDISSKRAGAASSSTAQAPANARCSPDPMRTSSTPPRSTIC